MNNMWIARDKQNILWLFLHKPNRYNGNWATTYLRDTISKIDSSLFPELRWEDEPIEVKLVPFNTNVIKMPDAEETVIAESEMNPYSYNFLEGSRYVDGFFDAIKWIKSKIM